MGIAPLRLKDGILYFIGSANVCDFLDFVIQPGREDIFWDTLLQHLRLSNHKVMDLSPLLPDSTTYRLFTSAARGGKIKVKCLNDDVSVALDLPQDLPAYLSRLNSKQRHELLRKERRLHEEGEVSYEVKAEPAAGDVDVFLDFFRASREDKNRFLTAEMESFFRDIIESAAANQTLRLGMLKLNHIYIAATLCFEHRDEIYLYNSGYNPDYRSLSAGLLSKYYSVKQSIETGKSKYDFLRGAERYKYHLGGSETQLFRCIINI